MALTSPIILDETLTYQQGDSTAQMVVGSALWFTWLESATAFTFRSGEGDFTARKERAGNQRGEVYWRAYRKRGGKLHRAYLGKSKELTLERLRAIAAVLAGQIPLEELHRPMHMNQELPLSKFPRKPTSAGILLCRR
jgi:LuxR family maltose regulon positive regulatory protein